MNHLKFCGCQQCRAGMHLSGRSAALVRRVVRRFRREAKAALKRGEEPERVASVPYTD